MEKEINEITARVAQLEVFKQEMLIRTATDDQKQLQYSKDMHRLATRLDKIDANGSKIMWILIAIVVAAAGKFVLAGGLTL